MTDDAELVPAWRTAAADPAVAADLAALYADVAAAVTARGPVCWASGRCCNFAAAGHLLYATGLETAYTLARLPTIPGAPALTDRTLAAARAALPGGGGCPFQVLNLCAVHAIRPLGCRIYFCDRSAQQWQQDLYEQALGRLREIHESHAVEYRYGEWRAMLAMHLGA